MYVSSLEAITAGARQVLGRQDGVLPKGKPHL